ncbi:hypothetical protein RFF05_00265 [Bengtsoniella intestinalis]|uniref:hypothetical protein n=1 Tax=Bengtsoniella intestinalis TaxID=3073143 RepID=UPI00391F2BAE
MEQVALQVDEQYFLLDTDQTVAWMDLVKYVTSKSAVAQPETPPTETPDITEIKQVIHTQMADVTHDGIPDIIETTISVHSEYVDKDLQALLNQTYPCDIAVYDPILSTNTPIYEQSYGAPHTGNGQLSLAEIDGLSYLLEGSLYTGQGYYTFAHSIFSLDSQGNRQVKAEDSTEGQISDGDAASKINTYFSNLTPWVERATAIAILDINLENQMVSTEDESYLAKDYYEAMGEYYNEMACEYALLSTPQPLTADELSYFNETYFNGATGQNLNPANQFLHNSFDLPINIDLFMLFYHGAGADYAMSEDGEYDAVAQAYGFDSWAEIPTDVTPIPKTSMDDMLEQYTGIDLFASNKIGLENFKYLEEYDCYYNLHGDTNYYGTVEFVSGTQTGDQIALSYYNSWQQADYILTLVDYGGGDYKIYSNLPAIIAE